MVIIAAGFWLVIDRVHHRTWSELLPKATIAHGRGPDRLLHKLRYNGVRVNNRVETALRALVGEWTKRPDLQKVFTTADGLPDVQGLLSWLPSVHDAPAFTLMPYRGSLDELGFRMAILPPNGDITPVLAWTMRNRHRPVQSSTDALFRVVVAWDTRPEIRDRFTVKGRVRVRDLLFWASTLPSTDPAFAAFVPVSPQLGQLVAEYSGPIE